MQNLHQSILGHEKANKDLKTEVPTLQFTAWDFFHTRHLYISPSSWFTAFLYRTYRTDCTNLFYVRLFLHLFCIYIQVPFTIALPIRYCFCTYFCMYIQGPFTIALPIWYCFRTYFVCTYRLNGIHPFGHVLFPHLFLYVHTGYIT